MNKRSRNRLSRIANTLYRDGVADEHKAVAFYKRMTKELRDIGFNKEADALELIAKSEEAHKDILNEIILNIKEKILLSQFKKETVLKGEPRKFVLMGRRNKR